MGKTAAPQQTDFSLQVSGEGTDWSILVMDDEELIRDLSAQMLEYLGYRVTTCVDGAEAISCYEAALASGAPFSAVIMDLTIPGGMGGKEAATHILAIDPKACLIVSSGYSNDPIMSDHRKFGFCGAVAKPYSIDGLNKQLRVICPARQTRS